jgi:hypothetical protein
MPPVRIQLRELIKISGRSFNDLDLTEVASMIEADSALAPFGNAQFDAAALDVFLHNATLTRDDLVRIRAELLQGIYLDVPDAKSKEIDVDFLREYAARLRQHVSPA